MTPNDAVWLYLPNLPPPPYLGMAYCLGWKGLCGNCSDRFWEDPGGELNLCLHEPSHADL